MEDEKKIKKQLIMEFSLSRKEMTERKTPENEYKWIEDAHQNSEALFWMMIENSSDIIAFFDRSLRCVSIHHTNGRNPEMKSDDFINRNNLELGLRESFLKFWRKQIQKVFETGETFHNEREFNTPQGTKYYTFKIVPQYNSKNEVITVLLIARDMTGIRRAEEALCKNEELYQSFVQNFHGIAYRSRMDFTSIFFHGAVETITGYTEAELLASQPNWGEIIEPEDLPLIYQDMGEIVWKISSTPGYSAEREYRIRRKDGETRWVHELIQNISDSSGKPILIQGVIYDITDRKKMEQELLKSRNLESIGVLAGGIAHDFNNFLTTILSNVSFVKLHVSPEDKIFNSLDIAEKTSLRASELANQLITFSKGGTPIKKFTLIGELIKQTTIFSLSGANVRCEFNLPRDLSAVEVDAGQMRQVIHHIVQNAKEAMPGGGIIHVTADNIFIHPSDELPLEGGKYVKISIKDHGMGISSEHLSKIYDPYFSTKQRGSQKGMGLGLTICYSIVKNHEGLITAESQLGEGTTFHIYLPVIEKKAIEEKKIIEKPLAGRGKVLLMDDEEEIRVVAEEVLRYIGYEVEIAKDGEEAIARYREAIESQQAFDAVILDLTVPGGMGGKEAIKRLFEIDPNVKAIVSSGYSNDPVICDFKQFGFRGSLAKPYKIEKLHETISGIISDDTGILSSYQRQV
jgi:PAS domain S-box-containing protein